MFYALTWQTHLLALACGMYLLHQGEQKIDAATQSMNSTGLVSTVDSCFAAKHITVQELFL